ncbi:Putative alpha-1,2-mannosidase [Mycobacterium numidiamassiliense]|uniref:Alpha-1,2-mannosidase n=1 Tax=Mycobacterium numidiamassiliense TaxID=1841861 RepID=A0A2U3P4R7_9MYCO|nr:GH92 family glycosyl hydrolase [Mycobacterium numidiamassiliense]SPM38729.1 Putative alpha-1,2-mannosidase [Mycobacterium numidiamassiliense]
MRSPRTLIALVAVAAVSATFVAAAPPFAYDGEPSFVANPVAHVDTLIGTGTGGETVGEINNFPGPAVPFGMVQYSPDTVGNYAGYNFDNPRATGFSMTHASVGCAAFGDISMLPTTRAIGSQPWNAWERIAHDKTERGVPGYYTVRFPETGVTAELTATARTGVGRFSYPHNGRPALFHVRSGASLAGNSRAAIQIGEDQTTITGWAGSGSFCDKQNTYTVYFAMRFSQPFTTFGTWDGEAVHAGAHGAASPYSGGYVQFPAGSTIEVRTALSYVSIDAARANLAAEGATSFEDVRSAASSAWNAALSRIAVAGRNGRDIETFYTSLYRSLLHPNTFNDVDGRYIGFDNLIHNVAEGHTQYTNFSDWDTYRCLAALQALLFPERASDMAQSLVTDAEQSGAFPRWPLANVATGEMTGDNVVPLIASLHAYGATDFDVKTALHYMVNGATTGGMGMGGYVERPGIETYLRLGYAPHTREFGPDASITLEWSIDDFAISRFAESLGDVATAAEFQRRAQYWHNLFNPTTHFISPRNGFGLFDSGPGFVHSSTGFGQDGFDEGNAEQYVWLVPHNVAGLATALGGRQAMAARLDEFVKKLNEGPDEPYLWAGNEPGFGVPWLYNYVGQPWKTQHTVDRVRGLFGPTPDGEPGNDDLGAMASWYVWAALGLYPITPGTPILTVSTPIFDRVVIALPGGKFIRMFAPGASGPDPLRYISGLKIDGQATDHTWLPESIIQTGGELRYSLAAHADKAWGTAESAAPPSFGEYSSAVAVNVASPVVDIAPGSTGTVALDAQQMIDKTGGYTINGVSTDTGITAAPVSGQFGAGGSATATVAISVAQSVLPDYYPLYLTTRVGESARISVVLVSVQDTTGES